MANEKIVYQLDAEDRATKKVREVTEDLESQAKQVKSIGTKAKASTELVGTLAVTMGGSGVGKFSGEMAQLTERLGAFTEVAQESGPAMNILKVGIGVGIVAMAFKAGQAIRQLTSDTREVREEFRGWAFDIDTAGQNVQRIAGQRLEMARLKAEMGDASALDQFTAELDNQIQMQTELIWTLKEKTDAQIEDKRAQIEALEIMRQFRQQVEDMTGAHQKEIDALRDKQRLRAEEKQGTDFIKGLGQQLALMEAQGEQKINLIAKQGTANVQQQQEAIIILKQIEAVKQKQAAKKAAQDAERRHWEFLKAQEKQQMAAAAARWKIQDGTLDRLKMQVTAMKDGKQAADEMAFQMQGFDAATAKSLARFNEMLRKAKEPQRDTPRLTGQNDRFGTGRQNQVRNQLLKDTATNAKDQKALLKDAVRLLEQIERKRDPLINLQVFKP